MASTKPTVVDCESSLKITVIEAKMRKSACRALTETLKRQFSEHSVPEQVLFQDIALAVQKCFVEHYRDKTRPIISLYPDNDSADE